MLKDIRKEYKLSGLDEKDLTPAPFDIFQTWLNDAIESGQGEPTAMTLATCTKDGDPDSRIVLLKEINNEGFVFFTSYKSTKGKQLEQNSKAALCFFWPTLERQVRVKGTVKKIDEKLSTEYFHIRPKDSQLGAWASEQSREIQNREELERRFQFYEEKFSGKEVDRPENWGGYVVMPTEIEFWQGRPNRLHDRFRYYTIENKWIIKRLAP